MKVESQPRLGRGEEFGGGTLPAEDETNAITFDIETVALQGAEKLFDPDTVALGNLKDKEKIAAKIATAKANFINKAALSPMLSRIVSIAYLGKGFPEPKVYTALTEGQEKDLIETFFRTMTSNGHVRISGYNILGFDLPFIYHRARVLGIELRRNLPYNQAKHRATDVYKELTSWMYDTKTLFPSASLENMAKNMNANSVLREDQCSGADYGEFILSGDQDKIKQANNHLVADVIECHELFKRL